MTSVTNVAKTTNVTPSTSVGRYICKNERRRVLVRQAQDPNGRPRLNGIDYLEVGADQRSLTVYFIHNLAGTDSGDNQSVPFPQIPLTVDNVQVSGGKQQRSLPILSVNTVANELRVRLSEPGDYSPYDLRLVQSESQGNPPTGIDPQLAAVEFRFWVEESSEFDCQEPQPPGTPPSPPPVIDYLAKDYHSFRQLMLDRLAVTMPEWKERNPADVGVMVVELLAYAADHLSYYQDAAATEAYLGTCRRRVSMRRHGRLLDYPMHDGCNARAWVVLQLQYELRLLSLSPSDDFPSSGSGQIIVAKIDAQITPAPKKGLKGIKRGTANNMPTVRVAVFDWAGNRVVDTGEFPSDDGLLHHFDDAIEKQRSSGAGTSDFASPDLSANNALIQTLLAEVGRVVSSNAPDLSNSSNSSNSSDLSGGSTSCPKPVGIKLLGPDRSKARAGVQMLSRTTLPIGQIQDEELYIRALGHPGVQIFETLHDLVLHPALTELNFYTWGNEQCILQRGATQATLADPLGLVGRILAVNRVLVFQEVRGPESGDPRDADLYHRHAVRLTVVKPGCDPLTGDGIVEVGWAIADALPFDLPLSGLDAQGVPFDYPLSVAYGNVVLADAGRTRAVEKLQDNPGWSRLRPRLTEHPLTRQGYVQTTDSHWQVFDAEAPASDALKWSLRQVRAAIALWEHQCPDPCPTQGQADAVLVEHQGVGPLWQPQVDLLMSDRFARDFVVESEEDGRAFLRFGDGTLGKQPNLEVPLYAWYRTGNGQQGNVGAGTLVNLWLQKDNLAPESQKHLTRLQHDLRLFNPLPAQGGVDPEALEQVRLDAPQAFREELQRAVTEEDYATITERYPGVQKAIATRRWTGSWQTIFITVDRIDGLLVDDGFKQGLLEFLEEFRLSGHDLAIESPRFVPLDIVLEIQVLPDYFQSAVKKALLDAFSNQVLGPNRLGFFHPDRFTFGQSVYLSQIVARAMQVDGVQAATVKQFQRRDQPSSDDLIEGVIQVDRLEIIQLDNVPNLPENGRIQFMMEGGL